MSEIITEEMKRFNYLTTEIYATYHEVALKLGLSDSAMLILYTICNNGESCMLNDICKLSGTSKQTINSSLRKLESEGIVYLERANGRRKKVCLTVKGKDLTNNTVVRLIKIENEIFCLWTKTERDTYIQLSQKYLTTFKDKIEKL